MAGEPQIIITGNLTADPELRFTQSGKAVASFTIASTPRTFDKQSNAYIDGDAIFIRTLVWGKPGENIAEHARKGTRVIAKGILKANSYTSKQGEQRTSWDLTAEEVGLSLLFGLPKHLGGQSQQPNAWQQPQQAAQPQQSQQAQSPWTGQQTTAWDNPGQNSEPPF